jgi:hypothetical protein
MLEVCMNSQFTQSSVLCPKTSHHGQIQFYPSPGVSSFPVFLATLAVTTAVSSNTFSSNSDVYTEIGRRCTRGFYGCEQWFTLCHPHYFMHQLTPRRNYSSILPRVVDEDGNDYPPCAQAILCSAFRPTIGSPSGGSPASGLSEGDTTPPPSRRSVAKLPISFRLLWSRAIRTYKTQTGLKNYVIQQTNTAVGDALFSNNNNDPTWPEGGVDSKIPTARFEVFGTQRIALGISHLGGCTFVVIVSAEAVYAAHYWEWVCLYTIVEVKLNCSKEAVLWETVWLQVSWQVV